MISWACWRLTQHADIYAKVEKELEDASKGEISYSAIKNKLELLNFFLVFFPLIVYILVFLPSNNHMRKMFIYELNCSFFCLIIFLFIIFFARYTTAFIYEVLRLHPSVPLDSKTVENDDVLPSGHILKKG